MSRHPKMVAAAIVRRIKDEIRECPGFDKAWRDTADEDLAEMLAEWYKIALEEMIKP